MLSNNDLGKAFEYACLQTIYDALKSSHHRIDIAEDDAFCNTKSAFEALSVQSKDKLIKAGQAASCVLLRAEPKLANITPETILELKIQSDRAGISGDVRDILCIKAKEHWEIGISCKHNHAAVKHSRLSGSIDFGKDWFNIPCSKTYFTSIFPIFEELKALKSKKEYWRNLADKDKRFYIPILEAFMFELKVLSESHTEVPSLMVKYLVGNKDFYKVIANERVQSTRVQAFNFAGTLNNSLKGNKPQIKIPILKLPSRFHNIAFKIGSTTTIEVVCDNGWQISMRIHNASSKVEPSLKFDVQLISSPQEVFSHDEPWDN